MTFTIERLHSRTSCKSRAIKPGAVRKLVNTPAVRKFAVASPVRDSQMKIRVGVRWIVFCAVLVFANLSDIAFAESVCPGIHVKILNIRNSTGTVACALFESSAGFPAEYLSSATNIMVIKVRHTQARCDFEDIPPGTYALAVVHDENMNGKLDANWLGIPTEGYGFSNDVTALLGAPSFSAASFMYNGQILDLTIGLHY